jgi:hypothetical protein
MVRGGATRGTFRCFVDIFSVACPTSLSTEQRDPSTDDPVSLRGSRPARGGLDDARIEHELRWVALPAILRKA